MTGAMPVGLTAAPRVEPRRGTGTGSGELGTLRRGDVIADDASTDTSRCHRSLSLSLSLSVAVTAVTWSDLPPPSEPNQNNGVNNERHVSSRPKFTCYRGNVGDLLDFYILSLARFIHLKESQCP